MFGSNDPALPQANGEAQIYLRDTEAGTTTLVSKGVGDAAGNGDSRNPVVTPDCRYVAWDSEAGNLVAPAQTQRLVYRRDLSTGTNVLISRGDGADGVIPNSAGAAFVPRMSADGNVVAFATRATNLSTEDTDTSGNTDVFVRVVGTDHTKLVSRTFTDAGITGSQGAGLYTSISADGRYVAFDTEAENLTAEDANSVGDVAVRDRVAGTTTLVSRATGGAPGDYHSFLPQISADGSRVAFLSYADNLGSITPPDEETPLHRLYVYVRDLAVGTTVLASRANGAAGAPGNADSGGQPWARDLRRRHQGGVPLAGDEPGRRRARLGRLPVVPAQPRHEHHPGGGGRRADLAVAGDQRRRHARGVHHRRRARVRRQRRPARHLPALLRAPGAVAAVPRRRPRRARRRRPPRPSYRRRPNPRR